MAATIQPQPHGSNFGRILRGIAAFLIIPLIATIVLLGVGYWQIEQYRAEHVDRIFTGINVWDVDVSGLTATEAQATLEQVAPAITDRTIMLEDPSTGMVWAKSLLDLGVAYDVDGAVQQAFVIGRNGDEQTQLRDQFSTWYTGVGITPNVLIDEGAVDVWLAEIAALIDVPTVDATLDIVGNEVVYVPPQAGRELNRSATRDLLMQPVRNFEDAQITLVIEEVQPRVGDLGNSAEIIQNIIGSPMTLYFEKPFDGVDLSGATLSTQQLVEWLRIEWEDVNGSLTPNVFLDEVAARNWIAEYADGVTREPERARFYFDDFTHELVLVEPHKTGRRLDVDATLESLMAAVQTPNRSVPFVVEEIVPVVNSHATAAELGITELITATTTYFSGSSPERMANIARSAENFYGIVIAPGEEFSYNHYLGEISAEQGYETGLIIFGGQTIEGIGGGVCQVSTTLYQAAFWGGYELGDRWQHGYRVAYYEDGLGPDGLPNVGMDATIYSPMIDFTFTNNTPHHLLIENYYNEGSESLTFKIYSTKIGRTVERELYMWNETDPRPTEYRYNPEWDGEDLKQVEWAAGGADVQIVRNVYNFEGALRDQNIINSSYVPWLDVFEYGDNTNRNLLPDYLRD